MDLCANQQEFAEGAFPAQIGSTSPSGNGANYIALSSGTCALAVADMTLAGEVTTGGLTRSQGDYVHADD